MNQMVNNKSKKNKGNLMGGFTLIELMVATSIFVIVMLAAMSSLFMLLDAGKNSRALRLAMDNINFATESMTRSIRMGTNYYCATEGETIPLDKTSYKNCQPATEGGTLVAFVSQPQPQANGETSRMGYYLADVGTDGTKHTLKKCSSSSPDDCAAIVSPDVNIETLKFFVNGSEPDDKEQASVYIMMKGTVMVKGVPSSFSIQTLASQRNF